MESCLSAGCLGTIDCNYMKTKFTVFEKRSTRRSNIVFGDYESSFCENYKYLGLHLDKKLNIVAHIERNVSKLAELCGKLYKLRETINKGQLVQYIRSYVSPIVHYGVLLYGLGAKTELQKILTTQKKTISNCLTTSTLGQRSRRIQFKELKIGTVFQYHFYELFKFSLAQIRNGFQNLTVGIQQRQTRNVSFNIWNFSGKNCYSRLSSKKIDERIT